MTAIPPLYAIVDVGGGDGASRRARALSRRLLDAGVRCLQVRAKHLAPRDLLALARSMRRACREARALLVVNDRLDAALAAGADGVHLGASDLSVAVARRLAPGMIIGATVRSAAGARRAIAAGASYVALGPMAPTRTKIVPARRRTEAELEAVVAASGSVPVVAVGGITPDRAVALYRAGAASLAVSGALSGAPDPAPVVRSFRRAWRLARRVEGAGASGD
ncbi:MAG: thiamine phosphate synthase [Acidobacteriota bacterium]